tara:strand:- start:1994 stop:3334 length:1341 start_codon:yes stop_codon:yes gene_type:complete
MANKNIPFNQEAERGVIGSILLDPNKYYGVSHIVKATDFYDSRNKHCWECITDYMNSHAVLDMITFVDYLKDKNKLRAVGSENYLLELMDSTIVASHSQYYAKLVIEDSQLRKQIKLYEDALTNTYKYKEDSSDTLIAQLMKTDREVNYSTDDIKREWKQAQNGTIVTIPTPYPSMDRQTGGIRQGMVTIFTGRSKSGKSMFLANWYNYLGSRNIPILAVPLEDKYAVTIKRMASNYGNLDLTELDRGGRTVKLNGEYVWDSIKDKNLEQGYNCLDHVSKFPIQWYDKKCTPKQLRGIAIRMKKKFDIQAMFVDGAKDLLRPSGKYNDVGFDEEISQQLCLIAEELNIAVISIHHLTKVHDEERINVNHIRGSGNIVGDSRAVYALQSSGINNLLDEQNYDIIFDNETGRQKNRVFECLVNNHGGTGMKALIAELDRCQFIEQQKR